MKIYKLTIHVRYGSEGEPQTSIQYGPWDQMLAMAQSVTKFIDMLNDWSRPYDSIGVIHHADHYYDLYDEGYITLTEDVPAQVNPDDTYQETPDESDEISFYDFISGCVRVTSDGGSKNYQHTHDRVSYNNENRVLELDEVCVVNEHGATYSRGIGFRVFVPVNIQVPYCLTGEYIEWADFDDLPQNYGDFGNKRSNHKR